jgi:hypothetical protein
MCQNTLILESGNRFPAGVSISPRCVEASELTQPAGAALNARGAI